MISAVLEPYNKFTLKEYNFERKLYYFIIITSICVSLHQCKAVFKWKSDQALIFLPQLRPG